MAQKRRGKTQKLHISYNAPVTLTFSLLAVVILLIDQFLVKNLINSIFTATGKVGSEFAFNWKSPLDYIRLFTHVLGHTNWEHLINNLSFILLLGPLLEERYGSGILLLMISITAFVTGVLNACFTSTGLLGASGIAFMMILLSSFTTISKNQIPLTFILIVLLYMGKEIFTGIKSNNISSMAHIVGGLCGSMFGFIGSSSRRTTSKAAKTNIDKIENKYETEKKYGTKNSYTTNKKQNEDSDSTVVISSAKF
ncbi:MAG: rhomboid family intramembrane serine protease [Spirochaetaceae bacterium]|nr:rhomboid family intramembrane serine protease [Spirochaetaceae bacterium]MBO5236228.1 rhomboid family intramembrane serine protease [Spirochaetaceae bacterium]